MVTIVIVLFLIAGLQRILPKFSVNRPVTTSMIFIGIMLLGVISVTRLPQELFPPITYPQLTVATSYANAAPEEIETLITKIIEEAISTVKNLKKIHSVSKEGLSLVIADFAWGTDMNIAALNMREKIDLVKEMLPRDAEEPVVLKYNPYALPVMILSVTGTRSSEGLLEISKKIIKDKLEKLEGVASANITGGKEREIRIEVDQAQLNAANTDLLKVIDSLKNANLNYPAGTTKEKFYEYLIRTMGEFATIEEIEQVPVSLYDVEEEDRKIKEEKRFTGAREAEKRIAHRKRLILLRDIAEINDTFKEPTSYSRFNGKENISIAIQKQADANTIQTVNLVKRELGRLEETTLPKGVDIEIVYDQSTFIKNSIRGVADAAWQGGILVFIVLFIFLRRLINSFIVTISIPISIFATFSLMYFQGFSINMISLGGLALGVGMLVDNSIVVVENIFRFQQTGMSKKDSAVEGANQVAGAIVASTLTTVAVFLPLVFLYGVLGQILKAFSFTIAFSLTASLFVGLSLIPLLSSRGKKAVQINTNTTERFDFITPLIYLDEKMLKLFMKHKITGFFILFMVFMASLGLMQTLDTELMPKIDTGQFTLKVNRPTGTRLETTNKITEKIEEYLLQQPDVYSVTTIVGSARRTAMGAAYETLGSHQSQIVVKLKKDRQKITQQFVQDLKESIEKMNLLYTKVDYIMEESIFSTGTETTAPIVVKIHGTDLTKMEELADKIIGGITPIEGLYGIKKTIASPSKETKILVYKDKASLYNINVRDIAQTALIAIKGLVATKFKEEGNEYDIMVRLDPKHKKNMASLKGIRIYSPLGFAVSLDELASLKRGAGPSEIERHDQQRVIFITANLYGKRLQAASDKVTGIISDIKYPEGYSIDLIGETEEAKQSFKNLIFIIILAFTLVYMIMASQFESTWQPFIIMFTVPFSIIGVAVILFVTGSSLNGMVMIGILLLGGVVVNNAIVLIEYLNQTLAEGKPLIESAIEASKIRLRPILMTAMTTVLGFMPMALSRNEGAELLSPLAVTVIGGLIFATVLTLWIIPVLYVICANLLAKITNITKG